MITDTGDNPPNILFVVWDACRYDYAVEHASFLNKLRSSNIWFEHAVAPSTWSPPSHASIFSGKLPHKHGTYRFTDSIDTPLVSELSREGYTTYGVSANGFASQRTGFDEDFDHFRYTGGRDLFLNGMDVSGNAQRILNNEGSSHKEALLDVLRRVPTGDNPLKSLANLSAVAAGEIAAKLEPLSRLPHPVFAPTSDYSYSPETNTRAIKSMLASHDNDEPFFLFTNYMDTHRCYKPPEALQRKHIGRSLSYSELVRLNEEVAATWPFAEQVERSELDESDVEDVRGLYAGEVETVDGHLQRLYHTLETEGLLEDTIVVVTADHGENLGETDEMGRRRMGHEASVSEAVLRVPLVIAHPQLEARTVSQTVSLKKLYELFLSPEQLLDSNGRCVLGLVDSGLTASQYPPKGGVEDTIEKYPDAPQSDIRHALAERSAVAYDDGWKVVAESTGVRWAGTDDTKQPYSAAPERLTATVQEHLSQLEEADRGLTDQDIQQLEALGYI
ncbi:sulfatase-like hydrolase/transferase [Halovenus salina]|uniref:Sulfatase-like hydrolase/transferase n=1 Tax=Halovenus salina TaxID=1510225 RepID=A0ABD5VWZ8_9EURY